MEGNITVSRKHFDMARSFFTLVENSLEKLIESGNIDSIFTGKLPKEALKEEYDRRTKWSDFRIITPVLFNYFHGLELNLKGLKYLLEYPPSRRGLNHKLSGLYSDFERLYPRETRYLEIIKECLYPSQELIILRDFYVENQLENSDVFYEVFKYPYNKRFELDFYYGSLEHNRETGIEFSKKLIEYSKLILKESSAVFDRNYRQ